MRRYCLLDLNANVMLAVMWEEGRMVEVLTVELPRNPVDC